MIFSLIGLILIWFVSNTNLKNKKKHACVTIVIVLTVLAIVRSLDSQDVLNYMSRYNTLPQSSFGSLFSAFFSGRLKDPFFYVVAKVFADVGVPAAVWVNLIGFFFAVSVGYFIYHTSDYPWFSYLLVITFFFRFTLTGLRQTVALSVALFAVLMILKRKPVKYIILVLIATLFHSSALIFLPMYWVSSLRPGKKQYIMIAAGVIAVLLIPNSFRLLIQRFAWNESLESYAEQTTSLSWSGFIISFLIVIFALIFRYREEDDGYDGKMINRFLNLMVFGTFFRAASTIVAEAFKIGYYFSLCMISAVPMIVSHQTNPKNKRILVIAVPLVIIAYFIYSNPLAGMYSIP